MTKIPDRCAHGHALVPSNVYARPTGGWQCRLCKRDAKRRFDGRTTDDRVKLLRERADKLERAALASATPLKTQPEEQDQCSPSIT